MYYFNIAHTVIVMIFYSFVSFNILTNDSSRIKNKEGFFISDTDILGGIYSPKKQKKKENNSGGKTKIDDYFGSKYKKESDLCIQNLLNIFHSRPVPDYRISTFVFLAPKVHFSQSQTSNFQNFLGKHALNGTLEGPKNFRPSSNENVLGLNSSTPLLIPFRRP